LLQRSRRETTTKKQEKETRKVENVEREKNKGSVD